MHNNWDDLRFVLTVAETGSVSGAARRLGVNHATVLRRVAAFESRFGGPVFEKSPQGYRILPDRLRVIDAAREVAGAVHSVERLMHGAKAPLRGIVRVASTDSLCLTVLPSVVREIHSEAKGLQIQLLSGNAHLDLSRMQTDVAVRPSQDLPEDMTGEVAVSMGFAVYCAPEGDKGWLGLSGALARSRPGQWMMDNVPPEEISGSADSFAVLREMAREGMGRAILPCFLGDRSSDLTRSTRQCPDLSVPLWVASHSDLGDTPRIRRVRNRILAHLRSRSAQLTGSGGAASA